MGIKFYIVQSMYFQDFLWTVIGSSFWKNRSFRIGDDILNEALLQKMWPSGITLALAVFFFLDSHYQIDGFHANTASNFIIFTTVLVHSSTFGMTAGQF